MTPPARPNLPEYSVSELSASVKRTLEDGYGYVRVRGELGRVVRAGSGHVYLDLKDERAVLSGVMWKGVAARQAIAPEQGMEVIASGKISTFPGQSKYQLIVDSLEPAGAGALMALLEERKKKLGAEGLFAPERKQALPFLPEVIGVVTSPSGAVIRDILHRLRDRFPRRVLVWPTLVQGRGAEAQIAAAIEGFNALPQGGDVPRPDVLIVARGGGSLEDLWCFNEEVVVRAAAASQIPLISAVGHETDTTLIDYAADQRAPTPSAAAEMAVPVRSELLSETMNKARRLETGLSRLVERARESLRAAARGLGRPEELISNDAQRLDRAGERLSAGLRRRVNVGETILARYAGRLSLHSLRQRGLAYADRLNTANGRLGLSAQQSIAMRQDRLGAASKLLETLSHRSALERGFVILRDGSGQLIRTAAAFPEGGAVATFIDGDVDVAKGTGGARTGAAQAGAEKSPRVSQTPRASTRPAKKKPQKPPATQKGLFD